MRVWTRRYIGVVCLNVLLALGSGACSSSQEEDENLESSGEQQQQQGQQDEEENQENGQQDDQEYNENNEGNENFNAENMEEGYNQGENNLAENSGDQGNATENDLQEIISEMDQGNGQGNLANGNQAAQQMQVDDQAQMQGQQDGGNQMMQQNAGNQMVDTSTTSAGGVIGGMAGQSAGQGLPEIGSKMPYIVRAGDTLAKISSRIYGTSERWREISALSGMDNPNTIYPGDVVYYQLSQEAVAFAHAYVNVSRQEIVVQQGDTLATISKKANGSGRHWKSIWRENDHIVNPDQLVVGQTIFYVTEAALTAAIQTVKEKSVNVLLAQNSEILEKSSNADTQTSNIDFEFETLELTSLSELITVNFGSNVNTNSAVTSNS